MVGRAFLPLVFGACLSQETPAPSTPPPALAAPIDCYTAVAQVPGIEVADPRLQADHLIVVRKSARRVQLFSKGRAVSAKGIGDLACYRVGLGPSPAGHKAREGDGRTPEGWYTTSDKPWSSFYAAIAVHYPGEADAEAGLTDGRITAVVRDQIVKAVKADQKPPQTTPLGGEILLHGGGSATDWTLGCVALDDTDIDDLRSHLPKSMEADIRILP